MDPLRQQFLKAQIASGVLGNRTAELANQSARGQIAAAAAKRLQALPSEQRAAAIQANAQQFKNAGIDIAQFGDLSDTALSRVGLLRQMQQLTAGQREFQGLTEGLNQSDIDLASRIKLGLDPRAQLSAEELALRERLKLQEQANIKPDIARDVAQAQADVEVGKRLTLEGVSEEMTNKLRLDKLKIDETKAKTRRDLDAMVKAKNMKRSESLNAVVIIDSLLKEDRFASGFGRLVTDTPDRFRSQQAIDVSADIDLIEGLISLEARQKLAGQGTISDSESAALAKSATILANRRISEDVARREFRRVRTIFEDSAARNKLASPSAAQGQAIDDAAFNELKSELGI
jgi:hypothetical protein